MLEHTEILQRKCVNVMPSNTTKKTTVKKSGTVKNKKLGKGLDAIFGGDISTLIDDIEKIRLNQNK